ncbi:MAG: hypothetical protein QW451_01895 [Candidatus Aenigmatarchaeota archaeon]
MKKFVRIYPREPDKKFDVEKLLSELYSRLESFLSPEKEKKKIHSLNYEIVFQIKLPEDGWKYIDEIRTELYQILRPYWVARKKPGRNAIPLVIGPEERDEEFWYLPISWRSSCKGDFDVCKSKIFTEVSALLLPEDMRWNLENKLRISVEDQKMGKTLLYDSPVPETSKFSFFDMSVDKEKVEKYYSQEIVEEVIKRFTEGRYVRIKYAKGCEQPKMRMWRRYKEEYLPFPKEFGDVPNYVRRHNMIQIYTSVDRRDTKLPDIFVIETDVGDMLKIIDVEKGHKLSFDIISNISNFLREYGIENYIHLSGHRSFHVWAGSPLTEAPKLYSEILEIMGIEEEKLENVYGFLRVLGKAVGIHCCRKLPIWERKNYSLERKIDSRNYKVLIDVPVVEKGAVGCPLSLHASSGLAYVRVTDKALSRELRDYENYKKFCNPDFAVYFAENHEELYSKVVHENKQKNFERLTENLGKEILLVLHTMKKDPNISIDYSLLYSNRKLEEICSMYF